MGCHEMSCDAMSVVEGESYGRLFIFVSRRHHHHPSFQFFLVPAPFPYLPTYPHRLNHLSLMLMGYRVTLSHYLPSSLGVFVCVIDDVVDFEGCVCA